MKPQTQLIMIALVIVFSTALALTVALICISHANETEAPDETEPYVTEEERHTEEPTTTTPPKTGTTEPPTDDTEEETTAPVYDSGLRFSSNGDGTCVLLGIGSCTDACVVIPEYSPLGDRVTEIRAKAFFECRDITAIQIPATVEYIGDLAFAACPDLVYISVSAQNTVYCDVEGVLYSADLQTLITYPSMRPGNTASIQSITREIADMAFYNCSYLTRINYSGTAEQWEKLWIGSKNYSLTAASKTFESGNGK